MNRSDFLLATFGGESVQKLSHENYQITMRQNVPHRYACRVPELEDVDFVSYAYQVPIGYMLHVDLLVQRAEKTYIVSSSFNPEMGVLRINTYVLTNEHYFERRTDPFFENEGKLIIEEIHTYYKNLPACRLLFVTGEIKVKIN